MLKGKIGSTAPGHLNAQSQAWNYVRRKNGPESPGTHQHSQELFIHLRPNTKRLHCTQSHDVATGRNPRVQLLIHRCCPPQSPNLFTVGESSHWGYLSKATEYSRSEKNPGTWMQISSGGPSTLPRETCNDVNADVFSITHGVRGWWALQSGDITTGRTVISWRVYHITHICMVNKNICWIKLLKTGINNSPGSKIW